MLFDNLNVPCGLPQVKRHIAFGDSDADGDVDSSDNTAHTAALTTYNRLFDADLDGDVSNTSGDADKAAWDNAYNEPASSVTTVVPGRGFSPTGNPFLFTGRRLDAETGLYFYRFRTYHPTLKVFLQRDPLGYGASGPNTYEYIAGMPLSATDPLGLKIQLRGPNRESLLLEIQKIVPSVTMDGQGYLSIPDSAASGSFAERLLYLLIHLEDTITIEFGTIKEPSWGKTDKNKIIFDPSKKRMKFRTKDGGMSTFELWQLIFHELFHALNNVMGLMKPSDDEEYCVACAGNKVVEEYNEKHKGKKAPLLNPGTEGERCPDYDDILKPPKEPSKSGADPPPSSDKEKQKP